MWAFTSFIDLLRICNPRMIFFFLVLEIILFKADLNLGWLNFPVIFNEQDRSYGPINIASKPLTLKFHLNY